MPVPDHSQRYGAAHRAARRAAIAAYYPGQLCALCEKPMHDWPSRLDLAHAELGGYLGLAHRRCNRGYGQADSNRARAGKQDPAPRPRTRW